MANYCIKPEKADNCKFKYRGAQIGTEKALCNIISKDKPCETEDVTIKNDAK